MNKLTIIFYLSILLICISGRANSEDSDRGLWKSQDCKEVSKGAGFFLSTSGELLKDADKKRTAGNEKKSKELYAAAMFFSDLSANLAKNFETFCRRY